MIYHEQEKGGILPDGCINEDTNFQLDMKNR